MSSAAAGRWPARYTMVLLAAIAVFICYMDRVIISVAIIPMAADFDWSPEQVRPESLRRPNHLIDRDNPRHHLAFGFGIHRCMGNRLAEMQLRVLWEEIMQRFSHVEVVGPPKRLRSNLIRGIVELPVRLHA